MLNLNQITLSRGNKVLLKNASATLFEKQKIGLVGINGCGKSSLFSLILGKLTLDAGDFFYKTQLIISHLSQQLPDSESPALDFVLAGDEAYFSLQKQLEQAEIEGNHDLIIACHEKLDQTGGYAKPAQAASIMSGLGFNAEDQKNPVNSFSGGWRMRLSLARCLMKPADLYLLDEPTNHLDMEAIFWLEKWLKQSPASILLISHDREFLDAFVTHILHIEQQNMALYTGSYSQFEQTRAQKLALQQASYVKQQHKIAHLMSYVQRFRAKASKAKQAQSRLKAIDKMEIIAQAQLDSPFSFEFYPCPKAGNPLLQCDNVDAGYQAGKSILKQINFSLNPGDRVALLGPNGEGKSTFIKTLTGIIQPLQGTIHHSPHLKIGYYAQHQLEALDLNLSPIQTIQKLSPEVREQTIRDYLGGFNFIGDTATHSIDYFSGGEKARLALAKLVWLRPNVLLLDEPTNHLDLGMRAAIEIALQSFEGALILISHDRHLLKTAVNDFYLVNQQKVSSFKGDLDDYHQWLMTKEVYKDPSAPKETYSIKEKKTASNRLKKLEQLLEICQNRLRKVEASLSEPGLYDNVNKDKLQVLMDEQKKLKRELLDLEEEWIQISCS
jgi:ATP-binding cassette subfamily F protein 3